MSRIYIRLIWAALTVISTTAATFSIIGLSKLFAGAAISVGIMAAALEFSKLVVTGFLYRYWGHIPKIMRAYLTMAVVILVSITSMGIFGYLSNAYQQSSIKLHTQNMELTAMEGDNQRLLDQIKEFQNFIDEIPARFISKKLKFRKEYEGQIAELRERTNKNTEKMNALKMSILETQIKIGPIIYFAKAVGADPEDCVKWLILLFVIVFDPLAVCLVFSLNLAIRLREKYRGNEVQISAHSLSTPVDHRYKKAA